MELDKLKEYFVGQRFICKHTTDAGKVEVFEMNITGIRHEPWGTEIELFFKYHESYDGGDDFETSWLPETLDEFIDDCWYCRGGWEFLGWIPVKVANQFPEEYFVI